MNLKEVLFKEILPVVEKASRYLGSELNSIHKDDKDVDLRIALVFPDLYDLGLGNLGLHILYSILNDLDWCWAERAYAPAPDMDHELRSRDLPLFLWESKDSLDEMDMIGFTFQSELTYTNVLNILDMSGIPLRSADRDDSHPLIFAGGPSTVNPEPMAPFVDFYVIGDGEEAIVEIAELVRDLKSKGRAEKLEEISKVAGVYVPELYPVETLPDGRILPKEDAPKIVRRIVDDMDRARFPTDYIVPYTQLVHDRVGLEVHRGCTRGCRFCQAGIITRPVRERSLEKIDDLMSDSLEKTGYEEVSLVSLSTCDYSHARELIEQAAKQAHSKDVSVSLPSLRLDSFSVELADMITGIRRSGLTFAPEAASPRLRALINKPIPDEELIETACNAYKLGWGHVKCYFMIGLPTETDEDIEAIVDLCHRTLKQGRKISSKAKVFTGISTFIPKPFTALQWAEQISYDEIKRRQDILKKGLARQHSIRYGRHEPESSFIEGLIVRSDRRAADLIETAYRKGARFESDSKLLNFDAWLDAIKEVGFDVEYAIGSRELDERLPWDHIDILVPKEWLKDEWHRSMSFECTPDCRSGKCNQCGVNQSQAPQCAKMLESSGPVTETKKEVPRETIKKYIEPTPQQRIRFRIGREDEACFLSHLEFMTAWMRALRRVKTPLSHTQGFHAHPKITFSTALPVGIASQGDYMDIVLRKKADPAKLLRQIQKTLPPGFLVYNATEVPLKAPSLMSEVKGFAYSINTIGDTTNIATAIETVLNAEEVIVERGGQNTTRKNKQKRRSVNIRPLIKDLKLHEVDGNNLEIDFITIAVNGRLAKPREIITLLGLHPSDTLIRKLDTYL